MIYKNKLLPNYAIYKIENLETGDLYIGSTNNAYKRFYSHQHSLRVGKHHSNHLQRAWSKYGEENFVFEVLEYPQVESRTDIMNIEQEYINNLRPKYNVLLDVFTPVKIEWNSERRHSMSISQKQSSIKNTEEYRNNISTKVKSLWNDTKYREAIVSSMNSKEALEKHKIGSAAVWQREGMRDKVYDAKMESTRLRGHTQNGLPVSDVYKIRELYDSGIKPKKISELYPNLSFRTLQKIAYRQVWKEL